MKKFFGKLFFLMIGTLLNWQMPTMAEPNISSESFQKLIEQGKTSFSIASTSQALLVISDTPSSNQGKIWLWEKSKDGWHKDLGPFPVTLGRNGVADVDQKHEGDGKSPQGIFKIGLVFGYSSKFETAMTYKQALEDDIWVDDPEAPDYNTWTKKEKTTAKSFEYLHRKDILYKLAMVVEYNTDPIKKGLGSAIFIHIWKGAGSTTAGCVAFSEENLQLIIRKLNPSMNPVIAIFPYYTNPN
ncbi:MAG: L,D-transpeptidase family protein [Candidatus Riflebacteria bacterium]|nr:L,D-transpeptidase family protein [Candidatus Riflebacteria bacterium]